MPAFDQGNYPVMQIGAAEFLTQLFQQVVQFVRRNVHFETHLALAAADLFGQRESLQASGMATDAVAGKTLGFMLEQPVDQRVFQAGSGSDGE